MALIPITISLIGLSMLLATFLPVRLVHSIGIGFTFAGAGAYITLKFITPLVG